MRSDMVRELNVASILDENFLDTAFDRRSLWLAFVSGAMRLPH